MTAPDIDIAADFTDSIGRAVTACAGLPAPEAATRLAADGLLGVIAAEAVGGLALPLPHAMPVASAAGAGLCTFPLVDGLLAARALATGHPEVAEAIIAGRETAVVGWRGALERSGDELSGPLGPLAWVEGARWLLAPVTNEGIALIDLAACDCVVAPAISLDMDRRMVTLRLSGAVTVAPFIDPAATQRLREEAVLLRAAEMEGCASACFEQARVHVEGRRQFGRPLSAFQAIRHELARHVLALAGLRRTLDGAARSAGTPEGSLAAHAGLALAAEQTPLVAEAAIQLNGAMGFTWDVPLHRHLRRIRALSDVMDATAARDWLAERLIADTLPLDPAGAAADLGTKKRA